MSDAAAKEAQYGNGDDSPHKSDPQDPITADQLFRTMTAGSSITPELFERLYLQPQNRVHGDLRKTFANPTPLAIMGFCVGLTPLSIAFMGWRGAGGNAVATGPASIWFGGLCLLVAGILEFILGNTFPFIVFMGYGSHFLTFATTWMPEFNAVAYFSDGQTTKAAGITPQFAASVAYYAVSLAILSVIFLFCSLRTNLVFVLIFICASLGFGFATGGFFQISEGNVTWGTNLIVGAGACFFGASMLGWYLLSSIMFEVMELPLPALPVYDLSTVIKAKKKTA